MTGRVYVAAPGVDPDDPWTEVGYLADETLEGPLGFCADERPLATMPEPAAATMTGRGVEVTWDLDPDSDLWRLLTGDDRGAYSLAPEPPTHAMTMDSVEAWPEPVAPRKRRGLTGKAYRIARRRYGRRMRAWRRAGGEDATQQVRRHFPRVRVTGVLPVPGMPGAVSVACQVTPDRNTGPLFDLLP